MATKSADPVDRHLGARIRTQRIMCGLSRSISATRVPYSTPEYAEAARTHLARNIINATRRGEWDQKKLSDDALLYLSRQRLR